MLLLWLILQSSGPPKFLTEGWGGLILTSIIPLSIVIGFIWRMAIHPIKERLEKINDPKDGSLVRLRNDLTDDIDGQGKRIDKLELASERFEQHYIEHQRTLDSLLLQVGNMREEFGSAKTSLKEMAEAMVQSNQQVHNLLGKVDVSMARMEERLSMSIEIKNIIRETLESMERQSNG